MFRPLRGFLVLESIDRTILQWVHEGLRNPVLDSLMPWLSWNPLFVPVLLTALGWLLWRGSLKGRAFAILLAVTVLACDGLVINPLRKAIQRPRPYQAMPEMRTLGGRTTSYSFPSSHTANWFAGATVAAFFWRRSLLVLGPLAFLVGLSRIYNGMHYPSDVLGGAVLGSGFAACAMFGAQQLWTRIAGRWFPAWHRRLPVLTQGGSAGPDTAASPAWDRLVDPQYSRLAYGLIALLLVVRWGYLAMGRIELSEDEAYQWLWSKHLDWSYYSKPPMIAWAQKLGTSLFGDNEFGVRFLSPLIGAVLSVCLFRFMRREVGARAGLWTLLATLAMPLLGVGGVLLTIDPLSVIFWTLAMIGGWRALQSSTADGWRWWALMGVGFGGGFLSKYTALFQLASWALFCWMHPSARRSLRSAGFWLALGILAVSTIPVLYWNAHHGWITVIHLHARAGLNETWKPSLRFLGDFVGSELALLNPVFLPMMLGAVWAVWREPRRSPFQLYLWCMGAPLFIGYLAYTFRARVQPNWIAPAVLPLLCLAVARLEPRWESLGPRVRRTIAAAFAMGLVLVVLLHETRLISKIAGRPLPEGLDPLARVRGSRELAALVDQERRELAREGKPVIVVGGHYGITSLITFYTPSERSRAGVAPDVFYPVGDFPVNQFFFWPGYKDKTGVNAIFVQKGDTPEPPPEIISSQFESVTDLGVRTVMVRGQAVKRFQLFACRGLRPGLK